MWFLKLFMYFHPALVNNGSSSVFLCHDTTGAQYLLPTRIRRIDSLSRLYPNSSPRPTHMVIDYNKVTIMDPTIAAGAARNTNVNTNKLRRVRIRTFDVGNFELRWILYSPHKRGARPLKGFLGTYEH